MTTPLRIALVAPPLERVPPRAYGGTERIVYELILELQRLGHHVTLFASGDSDVPCELVPTVPDALRPAGFSSDAAPYFYQTIMDVLARAHEFDLIHSHLEWASVPLMAVSPVPVVSTFHGRLDFPFAARFLAAAPPGLVAISASQASAHPDLPWSIVHNGLTLDGAPFDRRTGEDLCFVGRVNPEKGIMEAMEIARLTGRRLRIAAKIGTVPHEREYYEQVFKPALEDRTDVEFLGEVTGRERDDLISQSYAVLMPGAWPEPFGLVAIESLACGTPIIARRVGALPEIIRADVDGFFADDTQQMAFVLDRVPTLDRAAIRESVLDRFSARRMTEAYLDVYAATLAARGVVLDEDDRVRPLSAARADRAARDAHSSNAATLGTSPLVGPQGGGLPDVEMVPGRDAPQESGGRRPVPVMDASASPVSRLGGLSLDPRIMLATVPDRLLEGPAPFVSPRAVGSSAAGNRSSNGANGTSNPNGRRPAG